MALQKKPPVVTVMGHVDHGKTTLLDFIRKTKVASREYGEITQSIGAYQIEFKGEKITFIDTPGHAAFNQMRRRGARAADLAILVVSANDGVMPQTIEVMNLLGETQTPFLVAINKIDLPDASVDKIKTQLVENEVVVEDYGGKVVAVPVSAKTGQGIDQLLEMILLTAEMLDLKADSAGTFSGLIIEAENDRLCGPLATIIVKDGTLKKGDQICVEGVSAKIKMLRDEFGKERQAALPGDPAQILGFSSLPQVGSIAVSADQSTVAASNDDSLRKVQSCSKEEEGQKLKIILKSDTSGSLEAILGCLPAEVWVMEKLVGQITESDILLAKTVGAEIYAFNLTPSSAILKLAEMERVKIKNYRIIYDLLKDLEERILKIMEPSIDRKVFGKAEILATFEMNGKRIAGARVVEGKINKLALVMIQREGNILGDAKIVSFKQGKIDINEAGVGTEFGAVLSGKLDFQKGDMIVSFSLEKN